jgi:hypothetical protein
MFLAVPDMDRPAIEKLAIQTDFEEIGGSAEQTKRADWADGIAVKTGQDSETYSVNLVQKSDTAI